MSFACGRCGYSGWVVATHRDKKTVHSFRCGCRFSEEKKISQSIPQWSPDLSKTYVPDFELTMNLKFENDKLKDNSKYEKED